MQQYTSKYFTRIHTHPRPLGWGQNIFFSESVHVAHQINMNET